MAKPMTTASKLLMPWLVGKLLGHVLALQPNPNHDWCHKDQLTALFAWSSGSKGFIL